MSTTQPRPLLLAEGHQRSEPTRWSARPLLWGPLLMGACEVLVMVQRGMQWRGDLMWTIDWLSVAFVLVAPLLAGAAAVATANLRRSSDRVETPWFKTPAMALTLVAWTVHLVVLTAALLLTWPGAWVDGAGLAVVCQLLILAMVVAFGAAVGRFATPVISGTIAALATLVVFYVGAFSGTTVTPFRTGSSTVPMIGMRYNVEFLLVQAGVLVMLIVACAIAGAATSVDSGAAEPQLQQRVPSSLPVASAPAPSHHERSPTRLRLRPSAVPSPPSQSVTTPSTVAYRPHSATNSGSSWSRHGTRDTSP